MILKCSAGRYTRCDGEFSKVPVDSNKIGYIFRTKKPAITNDVLHDTRIKYPQWAKQENLKSFSGYPLTYNGESMGVLAMFSEKRLKPIEFELIGIFCENISKNYPIFLMTKNSYLQISSNNSKSELSSYFIIVPKDMSNT